MSGHVINVAFDRALEHSRQARIDAAQARIALELRMLFLSGMQGEPVQIPHAVQNVRGLAGVEHEALAVVAHEVLDYEETMALLLTALRDSSCSYVKSLRVAMAERVAKTRAAELAELECMQ
jgi:hypothetical protein